MLFNENQKKWQAEDVQGATYYDPADPFASQAAMYEKEIRGAGTALMVGGTIGAIGGLIGGICGAAALAKSIKNTDRAIRNGRR